MADFISLVLEYEVLFTCTSLSDLAGKLNSQRQPDVLLLDINLLDSEGLATVKSTRQMAPNSELIVITGAYNNRLVTKSIETGVAAFLYKPFEMQRLRDALEAVISQSYYFDKMALSELVESLQINTQTNASKIEAILTSAERIVVEKLTNGLSTKEMAMSLGIGVDAINYHLKNIYRKLNVHSRTELLSIILKQQKRRQ